MTAVPTIDVSALRSSDRRAKATLAAAIGDACATSGFFTIVNHGIAADLLRSAFAQTRRVFAEPTEAKMALAWDDDHPNRGYDPPGNQRLDAAAQPDRKEAWSFGPEDLAGSTGPMQLENQWPALPGFRPAIERYHQAALALCEDLLGALALSLDLDESYFAPFHTSPVCTLRLLHYPPREADAPTDAFGCGAHSDWGALTVLAQDGVGSLEVLGADGAWGEVPPEPGALVVNIGDLMARWTNDRYVSTRHRVIGVPERDRYSIACFFDLDHDAVIECLPGCRSADEPAKYPATTAGRHLFDRYHASMTGDGEMTGPR